MELGTAKMLKSEPGTTTVIIALWLVAPLIPVTVRM
jgi:hypothetical protein